MHILSLSDIQLIVELFESRGVIADASGRERQIDQLIRFGYLRPLSGTYVLTELGDKTARSLQMRHFVPSKAIAGEASEAPGPTEAADTAAAADGAAPALENA